MYSENTNVKMQMQKMGQNARAASYKISSASTKDRQNALNTLAEILRVEAPNLYLENQKDINLAKANGLSEPMQDRLKLNDKIIESLALGCEQLANMQDEIGAIVNMTERPSGIKVGQMRVPLGVFGMIFESRPNVSIEAASLAIKSGNACILRGGSEAINSNIALIKLVRKALTENNLPEDVIQLINTTDRAAVNELIQMNEYVDVIIPRGGRGLIELISNNAKIPVIKHLDGNCHTYIDENCDIEMALKVVDNAKTQKYSPCNATESLLISRKNAKEFLPKLAQKWQTKNIIIHADEESAQILKNHYDNKLIIFATEEDWYKEYLAPEISIKIVENIDDAISHINKYSSHHTEAIITNNYQNSQKFLRQVDSASVMINASTRFADGFEYGLGAEIGISTDKIHARGPVGVLGLTSLKWIVLGEGSIRV